MDSSSPNPPNLTQDLITEILLRLPAKPLARFKCVSISWNSLITSRYFILTHITHTYKSLSALHLARYSSSQIHTLPLASLNPTSPPPPNTLPIPFTYKSHDTDIFGSAHGLLGISNYPNSLSLYNPTNDTFHLIPAHPLKPVNEAHWVDFSLGYDSLSDDYKIVMVNQPNGAPTTLPTEVRVYSFKSATWKKLDQNFPHYLAYPKGSNNNGKYLANANLLLWVGAVNPPRVYNYQTVMTACQRMEKWDNGFLMVEFNLSTEKFHVSELPGFDSDGSYHGFSKTENHDSPRPVLVVSGADLLAQVEFGPKEERVIEVWLRKEYGLKLKSDSTSKWVKLMRFPYMEVLPRDRLSVDLKLVMVSEDGGEVLVEEMSKYFWVNVRSCEVKYVKIAGSLPEEFRWLGGWKVQLGGVVYVESLVALDNSGREKLAAGKGLPSISFEDFRQTKSKSK